MASNKEKYSNYTEAQNTRHLWLLWLRYYIQIHFMLNDNMLLFIPWKALFKFVQITQE